MNRSSQHPAEVLLDRPEWAPDQVAEVARRVRTAVPSATGLLLDMLALVPSRSITPTSSGKVRRGATRDLFTNGAYDRGLVVGGQHRTVQRRGDAEGVVGALARRLPPPPGPAGSSVDRLTGTERGIWLFEPRTSRYEPLARGQRKFAAVLGDATDGCTVRRGSSWYHPLWTARWYSTATKKESEPP
jgi:hypothetical protein